MALSNSEIIYMILFLTIFILVATIIVAALDWSRQTKTMLKKAPYIIPTGTNTLSIYDTPTYKRRASSLSLTQRGKRKSLTFA